jgi:hypothetical protein
MGIHEIQGNIICPFCKGRGQMTFEEYKVWIEMLVYLTRRAKNEY